MKIVAMGTGPFAVPSCQQLVADGHEILEVIVRPPANSKAPPAPVTLWAQSAGLPVYQPASINSPDALEHLRTLAPELYFVCDYGQILSKDCLSIPLLGGINLHGSLLPRHRGAAPVQWTILAGDTEAGVSVIHMTPGLDAGPVLSVRSTPIELDEDAAALEVRLSNLGAGASSEAVRMLSTWDRVSMIGQVQDKALATKAPRFSKSDGQLDFKLSATQVERRVRGLQPWPGAYGELIYSDSKRIAMHVRAARAIAADALPAANTPKPIGAAWMATAASLGLSGPQWQAPWDQLMLVQTSAGALAIGRVQPAGKRAMSAAEFLRGHPLTAAACFAVP